MPALANDNFDVRDFEIQLEDEDTPLRFSQLRKMTVNFDTVDGDGIGGTVVMNRRVDKDIGVFSGAPVSDVKWFEFSEDASDKIEKLCSQVRHFDVKIDERHYVNSLFKKIFLNINES